MTKANMIRLSKNQQLITITLRYAVSTAQFLYRLQKIVFAQNCGSRLFRWHLQQMDRWRSLCVYVLVCHTLRGIFCGLFVSSIIAVMDL